jgi:hypothetical protein
MASRAPLSPLESGVTNQKADLIQELVKWDAEVDENWSVPELTALLREIYLCNPIGASGRKGVW